MLVSDFYASKYMKKDDLVHPVVLTVIKIVGEFMQNENETKPVAHFAEAVVDEIKIKPCVLNKGNYKILVELAGVRDLEQWPRGGVRVEFFNLESNEYRDPRTGAVHHGAVRCRTVPTLKSAQLGNSKVQAYGYESALVDPDDDVEKDIPF